MNAGGKQSFVRIDVTHASDERLIQEHRLDETGVFLETRIEVVKCDLQRIRPNLAYRRWDARVKFKTAELTDVVVNECAFLEIKNGSSIFRRGGVPKQLARHAQMNVKDAAIQIEENLFAMPPYRLNHCARDTGYGLIEAISRDALRVHLGAKNFLPRYPMTDGANNSFDFG